MLTLWLAENGATPTFVAGIDRILAEDQSIEPLISGLIQCNVLFAHMASTIEARSHNRGTNSGSTRCLYRVQPARKARVIPIPLAHGHAPHGRVIPTESGNSLLDCATREAMGTRRSITLPPTVPDGIGVAAQRCRCRAVQRRLTAARKRSGRGCLPGWTGTRRGRATIACSDRGRHAGGMRRSTRSAGPRPPEAHDSYVAVRFVHEGADCVPARSGSSKSTAPRTSRDPERGGRVRPRRTSPRPPMLCPGW